MIHLLLTLVNSTVDFSDVITAFLARFSWLYEYVANERMNWRTFLNLFLSLK